MIWRNNRIKSIPAWCCCNTGFEIMPFGISWGLGHGIQQISQTKQGVLGETKYSTSSRCSGQNLFLLVHMGKFPLTLSGQHVLSSIQKPDFLQQNLAMQPDRAIIRTGEQDQTLNAAFCFQNTACSHQHIMLCDQIWRYALSLLIYSFFISTFQTYAFLYVIHCMAPLIVLVVILDCFSVCPKEGILDLRGEKQNKTKQTCPLEKTQSVTSEALFPGNKSISKLNKAI